MASGGFTFGTWSDALKINNPVESSLFPSSTVQAFPAQTTSTVTTTASTSKQPFVFTLPSTTFTGVSSLSSSDKRAKKPQSRFGLKTRPVSALDSSEPEEDSYFPKPLAPWRSVEWTEEERSSLMEQLSSYTPSSRDVPQARVLLLGPVGSGKSSFISSVQSVFNGRVSTRAMVGHGGPRSFTRKLESFPLHFRDSAGGGAVSLCDMMGFSDGTLEGPTLQQVLSVIKGHAPEGYQFRADEALSSDTEGFIKRPGLKEQIHCVAFVLDASKVRGPSYSKGVSATFQELRRYISDLGVHQVVLLTHVDRICPETAKDTSSVYSSIFVRDTIFKAAELVGLSPSSVVPVRNYWCELDLELSCDVLLLRALDHILQSTELLFTKERDRREHREHRDHREYRDHSSSRDKH